MLLARDGGCLVPGCSAKRFVDAHHVRWWDRDAGPTDIDNLIILCWQHHTAVHDERVKIKHAGGQRFAFDLADGAPLTNANQLPGGESDTVTADNIALNLDLDDDTAGPDWSGDTLDLGYVLDGLFTIRQQRRAAAA